MTGLDTNVLVRYVMQDDPKQAARATQLIESFTQQQPGWVAVVSVAEFVWVLESCFDLERDQIALALATLLRSSQLVVEQGEVVWRALRRFKESSADFADCLIERSAVASGCERTMTFDRNAAKHAGMSLLS